MPANPPPTIKANKPSATSSSPHPGAASISSHPHITQRRKSESENSSGGRSSRPRKSFISKGDKVKQETKGKGGKLLDLTNIDSPLNRSLWNDKKCPCDRSIETWMIDCSKCEQYWHVECVTLNGLSGKQINLLHDWLCPLCYTCPIATTDHIVLDSAQSCMSCRNTRTLRDANNQFETSATAANLEKLGKPLSSIDTEKLSKSLELVQNMDLHLQHLLVSDDGLEKFQTLPNQISTAIASKLDLACQTAPPASAITEQFTKLHEHIDTLSAPSTPAPTASSSTDQLLEKISTQLNQLCENEETVSTSLNELKSSIQSHQSTTQSAPSDPITSNIPPTQNLPPPPHQPTPPAPLTDHGQSPTTGIKQSFINDDLSADLIKFLEDSDFKTENGHSVITFGAPYTYTGSKSSTESPTTPDILKPLFDDINTLQKELYYTAHKDHKNKTHSAHPPVINSCLVNKYDGPESSLPLHADDEVTIDPDSSIFTLSLGTSCQVKFVEKSSDTSTELTCPPNSLYYMTRKSQEYFKHCIEAGSIEHGVRYSLTFRAVCWKNRNATCILGDSNTGQLRFGSSKRSSFGELMPGRKFWAPRIHDITPQDCIAYTNAVILCGINDLKLSSVRSEHDIKNLCDSLIIKVKQIKQLNPKCFVYVCPLLPTKDADLNLRVNYFNTLLMSSLSSLSPGVQCVHGFQGFADHAGMLSQQLSKTFDRYNNPDVLHLNEMGARILASFIKRAIFHRINKGVDKRRGPVNRVNGRTYSSVSRTAPPPWLQWGGRGHYQVR